MSSFAADPQGWSPRRLWTMTGLAVVAQVGLIFWFSEKAPLKPHAADAHPVVQLAPRARGGMLALTDPTLFSLPHREGFSGPAWMTIPSPSYRLDEESDSPQWLAMSPQRLGATFRNFAQTNQTAAFGLAIRPQPELTRPGVLLTPILATNSTVEVQGALAGRTLLSIPPLESWPAAEILAASVVHVLVDARGNAISAVLLKGSGSAPADRAAVKFARAAQFGPDQDALRDHPNDPNAGVTSGRLVFHWHTVPAAGATNTTTLFPP